MNQKKLEKLQKLYALASNNPNQNEAIVAAHKFINAIKKDGLHMTLSEQPQATQEQINQALQANYQKGFTEGSQHSYNQGYQAGYAEGIKVIGLENQNKETGYVEQTTYQPSYTTLFVNNSSSTIRIHK
jgi:flagellar biosynthesis/type III secretory pathway protein FliH